MPTEYTDNFNLILPDQDEFKGCVADFRTTMSTIDDQMKKNKHDTYVSDYGGDFASFAPPTGWEGRIIIVIDTNATSPGKRLYCYANSEWHYVNLT